MSLNQPITPLVSIACITYNQSKHVRDTLDGFIMQKINFPIEISNSLLCNYFFKTPPTALTFFLVG